MNLSYIDKAIQGEFALKKINAELIANQNLKKAHSIPAFKKLEKLEKEVIFKLGKEKSMETQNSQNIDELTKTLTNIKALKTDLLNKLGLGTADLEPNYSCKKCKDTGILYGKVCECYTKRRNEEIIKSYRLDDKDNYSFDEINTDLFQDNTQLDEFFKLKSILEKWCNSYPNIKNINIILGSPTGLGKTFLLKSMAKKMIEKNFSVCYVSAFQMNSMMLKYHTAFDSQKESHLIPLLESEILFIDDLGTEPLINNVTINYLFNILSERESNQKPTIISTNLSKDSIKNRYGERINSRLFNKQISKFFGLAGVDLRNPNLKYKK